jgi:predicted glycosyltransferase
MKTDIIIVTPSAPGLINHGIALALGLESAGLSTLIVTGPEAAPHLQAMNAPVKVKLIPSHACSFDRRDPARQSHIQQTTDPTRCRSAAADLIELVHAVEPRWLIGKNFPHVALCSALTDIPWASYLTGGPVHIDSARGPLFRNVRPEDLSGLQRLSVELLGSNIFTTPDSLFLSPRLNLIRGVPVMFPGERQVLERATRSFVWTGALTFDGPEPQGDTSLMPEDTDVFVTFGTVCYDDDLYRQLLAALANLPWRATVTSLQIPLEPLLASTPSTSGRVHIARYIPNSYALRRTRIVVHHGGMGTTLSALKAGVPQLIIPLNRTTSCQEYHALNLIERGVACSLSRDALSAATLSQTLQSLLSPDIQSRAIELARELESEHVQYSSRLPTLFKGAPDV